MRHLEGLQAKTSKKAKASVQDRHPAYLRDIRTLCLILYSMLIRRQEVVFYTTDGDAVPLLFKWLDSMSMRLALCSEILPEVNSRGIQTRKLGKAFELLLSYEDFIRRRQGILRDLFSDQGKESGFRFIIRRWNQTKLCFEEDVWLTFTKEISDLLSSLHGNYCCPFAENKTHGNWLHFNYHWPPEQPEETQIRVQVTMKPIANKPSLVISSEFHGRVCKYPQDDASGEISAWSDFV